MKKECPKCKSEIRQMNSGYNKSGTQRCLCGVCNYKYTLNPKQRAYPEEIRNLAIKEHLSGVSGRRIGQIHGMSKANVYNWIKKNRDGVDKSEN